MKVGILGDGITSLTLAKALVNADIYVDVISNDSKRIINKIESALDEIRPYLRSDGGDISLVEVTDDYTVKVKLMGACETCHVSMMTLKNGVEVAVKNAVPKVKKVVEISSQN